MNNHRGKSPGGLKRHFLMGSMYASSAKVFAILAGFATQILIARLLGPEVLGVFFLFFSIIGVCVLLVKAGLDRALLRLIAEANGRDDWGTIKGLVKTGVILVACSGITVTFLLWVLANPIGKSWFNSSILAGAISIGCIIVLLQGLQGIVGESFRGFHAIGRASYFQGPVSSGLFLLMLLGLWLSRFEASLDIVIILSVVSLLISVSIASTFLMRLLFSHPAKTNKTDVKMLLSIASPMLITGGAAFILTQSDIFILGIFMAESEVGFYGAASRLASMVVLILLIINANIQPLMAELYSKGDIVKLERIARSTATIGLCISLPISSILIMWGDEILNFFYGSQFIEGSTVLALLTLGNFIHVSTGSGGVLLLMTGYHKAMMYITIIVALLTLIGILIVVRPYGKEGVAAVVATALIVQSLLQVFYAKRLTGIWTIPTLQILFQKKYV